MGELKITAQEEWDALGWLHLYGQYSYHSEAHIRGTKAGLEALRDAINAALEAGTGKAEVIAADGEGYTVEVERVNTNAALGSPEYVFELEYSMARQERQRRDRIRLGDRHG